MENNQMLSLGDIASALAGAGLTQITTSLNVALMLIGLSVAIKVTVAVLNRYNIPISGQSGLRPND